MWDLKLLVVEKSIKNCHRLGWQCLMRYSGALLVCSERHTVGPFVLCEGQSGGKLRVFLRQHGPVGIVLVKFHAGGEAEVQHFFALSCVDRLNAHQTAGADTYVAMVHKVEFSAFQIMLDVSPGPIAFISILKFNVFVAAIIEHKDDLWLLCLCANDARDFIYGYTGNVHAASLLKNTKNNYSIFISSVNKSHAVQ